MPRTYNPILEFLKKIKRALFRILPLALGAAVLFFGLYGGFTFWPSIATKFAKNPVAVITNEAPSDLNQAPQFVRALDGKVVASVEEETPVNVSIMVENNLESWPLSGLDHASIVYEALAEGRIPRFLAILPYGENVEKIGPVRSARTYYLELQKAFDAIYMHVGGSPDGLKKIKEFGVRDFDQFFNSQYFWRDTVRNAPHNVYTSAKLLTDLITEKQLDATEPFKGWIFKDAKKFTDEEKQNLNVKDIVVSYTTGAYQAKYVFNADRNQYQRYQAKEKLKMLDGSEIYTDNVIIEEHNHTVYDVIGRRNIDIIGEGKAWIFRDGEAIQATWKKPTREELTRYYDSTGKEIELNRGKTWINIVEPDTFTYDTMPAQPTAAQL